MTDPTPALPESITDLCDRSDCTEKAKWNLGLKLYADLKHPPAKGYMKIKVCDFHKLLLTVDDVLDERGWLLVCNSFYKTGFQVPDRALSQLYYEPLGTPLPPDMPPEVKERLS